MEVEIEKASKCLILTEEIHSLIQDDLNKILAFKSIDNLFNIECILEVWNDKSLENLGYSHFKQEDVFSHPLFTSGNILLASHLEKITAKSFLFEKETDTVLKMIRCGYDIFDYDSLGLALKEVNFPVIITIDIPECYSGKEFSFLAKDLLSLPVPVVPLGVYVKYPALYLDKFYRNRIDILKQFYCRKDLNKTIEEFNDFLTNEAEDSSIDDSLVKNYFETILKLQSISINNKAVVGFTDKDSPHLPIYITNPYQSFVLHEETSVTVLIYHKLDHSQTQTKPDIAKKPKNKKIKYNKEEKSSRTELLKSFNQFLRLYTKCGEN